MIRDLLTYDGDGEIVCDLCIAGAGAAGITLAHAFAGQPERVVVLESGGLEFEPETQELYAGRNVGEPYFDLDVARLRYLGGSTNHWGGMCAPLDARDFEARPWVPHSGWPITRADLAPHYPRANAILELGPFEYVPEWFGTSGLLPFASDKLASRVFRYSLPPMAMGESYRGQLEHADNVTVLLHANLADIALRGAGGPVAGFEARTLDGRRVVVRARAYVLALGGIENPRMLLNADAHAPNGLGNQHDLVGRFFMDHVGLAVGRALLLERGWEQAYLEHPGPEGIQMRHALAPSDDLLAKARISNVAATFGEIFLIRHRSEGYTSLSKLRESLSELRLPDELGHHLWNILSDLDGVAYGLWEKYDPTTHIVVEAEQAPNPDSRVLLEHERDPLGLRRVALDWRLADIDKRTMRTVADALAHELGRLGVARVQIAPWLLEDDFGWSDELRGSYHHIGTTRMADDPTRGVVDPNCRVFGCDNLYVAGSSVFPTSGFANPTLTIVALALRLADHLRKRFHSGDIATVAPRRRSADVRLDSR